MFLSPLRTCALKFCSPSGTIHTYMCVKTYIPVILYDHSSDLQSTHDEKYRILCQEKSAAPVVEKILAMVFSRSEMALTCLCPQILPPPP